MPSIPDPGQDRIPNVFDVSRLLSPNSPPRQREALLALLERLGEQAGADLEAAREACRLGQYREAAAALHALRGSIGTLGANTFAATSRELEAAVKAGQRELAETLFPRAGAELAEVAGAVRAWLDRQARTAAPAPDDLELAMKKWKKLLSENNIDAVAQYHQLKNSLGILDTTRRNAIQEAMARLDFPAVLTILGPTTTRS
ncbi:Hpt domain-containing protein [Pseudoduganella namucuonensis]|uniref:Hpt domain-containing protein n=1 Tax=Pseudoduganella namucuonensis TaxID=1035707 RepID=A0A1I7KN65_9BURK|nr:Hpt domain-containing protein [Pseudoduganella namucuonensis]SFU98897.1 Hpt domain-containing protein [Pseudoduganella namucuonensis]